MKMKLSENEYRIFNQRLEEEKIEKIEQKKPERNEQIEIPKKKKFKFSCEKTEEENFNHNEELTKALEKLENIYLLTGDVWRSLAYRKSIRVLKTLKFKVNSILDLNDKKGIGEKTMEKINEYLTYGKINRLGKLSNQRLTSSRQIGKQRICTSSFFIFFNFWSWS